MVDFFILYKVDLIHFEVITAIESVFFLDFYSHSNWIEKDKRQPHPTLGVRRFISSQFAAPNVRTCKDCTTGPDAVCRGNCIVSNGLTSGYYIFGSDIFTKKPTGKCSHGGSTDATRNNDAIGGINKDALSSIHGYLHVPAAQTAYLATCKILREFRAQVGDVAFGKFLNVLSRRSTTSRSADSSSEENDKNSAYVYTSILKKLRKTDSFTIIRQIVTVPAIDFIYKAQILSLAKRKHVAIDIFCPAKFHQSSSDFGQDLATLTGGMFTLYDDDEQISIDMNPDDRPELIGVFYTKSSSNILTINIDQACSDLLLEFFSKHKINQMQIQLRKGNQTISSPLIITDTKYYRSYRISNLSPGQWQLIISRSKAFIFDLHASCSSSLRCFSRVLVDNGNPIHPGQVELQGNLIEKQAALLMSTCDSTMIPIQTVQVMMIDSINGALLASPLRSVFDESSNRWMTNLTNIPSKQFRLKFSINHGTIIRLSRSSYQPSLVDVQITKVKANGKNKMMITYRVLNYYSQSMKLTLLVKNVGNFSLKRKYEVKAGGSKDDVFEYDSKDGQSNMISLTVKSAKGDWNYDVVSF